MIMRALCLILLCADLNPDPAIIIKNNKCAKFRLVLINIVLFPFIEGSIDVGRFISSSPP
ncbi:hypothetical protein DAPPUDRAFT_236072 [Daphnia pulex]|uniref:Uncharacterized protein n=1 Tax=Daphnia pulex TaxID=6669 RepID=E9FZW3_DAPPU|nr:hypothetical protein DAPPUDRAFT_236072 [Daphnia pulex]|eukprot:EFX87188.1 hypothetical protein DAPPUDRAFT_236072 [Daphnia pulex]